jgi:hypothetical protein
MDTGGDHRMLGVEELTDYPLLRDIRGVTVPIRVRVRSRQSKRHPIGRVFDPLEQARTSEAAIVFVRGALGDPRKRGRLRPIANY